MNTAQRRKGKRMAVAGHSFVLLASLVAMLLAAPSTATGEEPTPGPAGELYVPEVGNDSVAVLDSADNSTKERLPIHAPVGPSRPSVMTKTPDGSKIYVHNFGLASPTISIIDRKAGTTRTIPVESTPMGIFTSADGKEIYIPELNFVVEVLDVETDTIVRKLRFADIPVGAIAGPDGNMYVGFASGLIGAYDPKTGATVKPPIWSGGIATFWYDWAKDGSKLYTSTINSIGVIDMDKWQLTKTIATNPNGVGGLLNPGAFINEVSPDGTKMYVTMFGATGVLIVDLITERVIGTVPTDGYTIGVTFSDDGSRGYITDVGPAPLDFLPGPLGEGPVFLNIISLAAGFGPGTLITFDPKTGQILDKTETAAGPGFPVWVPDL